MIQQIKISAMLISIVLLAFFLGLNREFSVPVYAQDLSKIIGKYAPEYTRDNKLKRPLDTEKWIFVGSNLGLKYSGRSTVGNSQYHNVYISPPAYESYKSNGEFPDGTMLLLDRYVEESRSEDNPIISDGTFNGDHVGFDIAVKNFNRPDITETSKASWAYYGFGSEGNLANSALAFSDAACQECHAEHASDDHVWVQFYPILRRFQEE